MNVTTKQRRLCVSLIYNLVFFVSVNTSGWQALSWKFHKPFHPKTPMEFLCTESTLTGNLAKFHHSSLDIYYSRYVLVTYRAETMTTRLLIPFTISGWMNIQQFFKETLFWQIYSMPVSDPSSWQRLDIILWTSSKGSPSYWIWRRSWFNSRTLG